MNPVPMTEVRPRLTEIIDAARDRDEATALTEYKRPRAFVVSVPFFERAERNAEMIRLLAASAPELHANLVAATASITVPLRMSAT